MARKDRGGSIGTPATVALTRAKIAYAVRAYEHDPAAESFGLEAAQAPGVEPARVFKTLLVDTGAGLAVGVMPVDRTLDLKAMATALRVKKVAMADPPAAERSSGYVVGGISPIGQKRALPTWSTRPPPDTRRCSCPAAVAGSTSSSSPPISSR